MWYCRSIGTFKEIDRFYKLYDFKSPELAGGNEEIFTKIWWTYLSNYLKDNKTLLSEEEINGELEIENIKDLIRSSKYFYNC